MEIPLAKQEELWERYQQTERFKHLDGIAEEANRAAEKASKEADLTHDAEDSVFWGAHDLAMELNQVAIHAVVDCMNDWQAYLVDTYLAELALERAQAELQEDHNEDKRQEEETEQCALGSNSCSVLISKPAQSDPDCPEVRECPQTRQRLQRSEARSAKGCGVNTPPCVVQAVEPSGCEAQSWGGHQPSKVIGLTRGLRSPALSLLLLLLAFVASWFGTPPPVEAEFETNTVVVNPHSVNKSFEGARLRSLENTGLRGDCQPAPN